MARMFSTQLLLILWPANIAWGEYNSTHYTAAVVDYHPDLCQGNRWQYYVNTAKNVYDAEIVIFPEDILTTDSTCPDVFLAEIPPLNSHPGTYHGLIAALAMSAQENSIYIVFNVREKVGCNFNYGCPDSGFEIYSTNVVMNRDGTLIAKVRKDQNYTYGLTSGTKSTYISDFETDFGAQFNLLRSKDLTFHPVPADSKVRNYISTEKWTNELPFLTSIAVQQGWAQANNVNLLVAGHNDPDKGLGGSGIYSGVHGPIISNLIERRTSEVSAASVPKTTNERVIRAKPASYAAPDIMIALKEDLSKYESKTLKELQDDPKICSGDFCCSFSVKTSIPYNTSIENRATYRGVVYNGERQFGDNPYNNIYIQVCGIIACETDSLSSCGYRLRAEKDATQFDSITISARYNVTHNIPTYDESIRIPITLMAVPSEEKVYPLKTLDVSQYNIAQAIDDQATDIIEMSMSLTTPTNNLVTFGIYSHIFYNYGSADGSYSKPSILIVLLTSLLFVLFRD